MSRAGVRPDVSERVMGHAIEGVEGVYDRHSYLLLGREGPTVSMLRAAKALWSSKQAGR